jgi:hypothetical protein
MTYTVDATNSAAPLALDTAGPFIAAELRAIKAYYLTQLASINSGLASVIISDSGKLKATGDTVLGDLVLSSVPTNPAAAISKSYVDTQLASILAALTGASLASSHFMGVRLDANFNLIVDFGVGTWNLADYVDSAFVPLTTALSLDSAGTVILTY